MCIHADTKLLRGRAQNQACRTLCKSRSCHHQNRVAGYLQAHPDMGEEPFDIEDLVNVGRTQGPCPYYLSRELHNSADILFAPYNYVIEKENRHSLTGIHWENTVLIFDEAHNLESICADSVSFDLPAAHLSACIVEARQCVDLALAHRTRDNSAETSVDPENFAILKALLLELEKRINDVPFTTESGFTRPGPHIYDFLADIKINQETVTMLIDTIDHAINLLEDEANLGSVKVHKRPGSAYRLQALRDALRVVFQGKDKSHATCYRFHIHEPYGQDADKGPRKGPKGRTLSWWCFNPGLAMEEFSQLGVRTVILTSGTLSPLDSFALELKLPFKVRLENPHVVGPDQIWVGVVSTGPSGRLLNSSYRMRDSLEYKLDLGNTIVNFARIVPDGLLVFFPSYYLLNQCVEAWQTPNVGAPKSSTVWERICKHKQPVIEPKESALFNHANEDFITKLNDATSSGAVFFAVCRGKVSEGLDFADKAGRAVVITGIPYAMKTDPKVRLKREYLDEQSRLQTNKNKALTGEEWYVQQASRAVNQAVGRVIRHREDYGAIILCDERFAQGSAQNQMSLWLRPHIKCYSKFGDATFSLTRFFRDKASTNSGTKKIVEQRVANEPPLESVLRGASTNLCDAKSLGTLYLNIEAQGTTSAEVDKNIHDFGILSQKFTRPSGLHCGPSSAAVSSGPEKSLSSILANSRGNSTSKQIPRVVITPANRAIGSEVGTVCAAHCGTTSKRKGGLEIHKVFEGFDCDVVDLASPSPSTKQGRFQQQIYGNGLDKRMPLTGVGNGKSQQESAFGVFKIKHTNDQGVAAHVNREQDITCGQFSKAEDSSKNADLTSKDDKKSRNAADFLKEVKARLSAPEYKGFVECMKGLRQQVMNIKTVLEAVANLFSAPERIFLLRRFGEFVPTQHRELYETCLAAKSAAVEKLSGRQFAGDKVPYVAAEPLGLHGFPSRSRKRPGGSNC